MPLPPRNASWTAVAERSDDTAFARAEAERTDKVFRAHESGVALHFPPQSKTRHGLRWQGASRDTAFARTTRNQNSKASARAKAARRTGLLRKEPLPAAVQAIGLLLCRVAVL